MNQNRPLCKNYRFAQIFASRGGSPIRNLAFALHKLLSHSFIYRPTGVGNGEEALFFANLFIAQMPTMQSECCPLDVARTPVWGNKPPRRKRGSQRRLADISFFAGIGVEPSPLFEWSVFAFFRGGPKEGRLRRGEIPLIPVIYATPKACLLRTHPVRLPSGFPDCQRRHSAHLT